MLTFLDDLEERLLVADLGIHATTKIIDACYILQSNVTKLAIRLSFARHLATVLTRHP